MARNLALLLVGVGLGLGLGWLLFHQPAPGTNSDAALDVDALARPAGIATLRPARESPRKASPSPPGPGPTTSPSAAAPAATAQVAPAGDAGSAREAELRAMLERTQRQLDELRAERTADIGKALEAPPGLDARFGSDALLANVIAALKAAGLGKAQVTSIDCSEYPCIVYGDGLSGPGDFERLAKAPGWAYGGDRLVSGAWGGRGDADHPSHFALAAWPRSDETGQDAMSQRFRYRFQQMAQTFAPPKK